jgi:hypothetical protein
VDFARLIWSLRGTGRIPETAAHCNVLHIDDSFHQDFEARLSLRFEMPRLGISSHSLCPKKGCMITITKLHKRVISMLTGQLTTISLRRRLSFHLHAEKPKPGTGPLNRGSKLRIHWWIREESNFQHQRTHFESGPSHQAVNMPRSSWRDLPLQDRE